MTTETDTEFERGLSPHTIHHDPRLPSQHTLDARQLRVLHRAIDTLAFTAEQYREHGSGTHRDVLEALDRLHSNNYPSHHGIAGEKRADYAVIRLALSKPTIPRDISKLIDATTAAWQPLMTELIEQQDRFRRGG